MASLTGSQKDDNDPYTGSEMQHDFGPHHGHKISAERIKHADSLLFRNYLDERFLFNHTKNNRGTGNQPDWAYEDAEFVKYRIQDITYDENNPTVIQNANGNHKKAFQDLPHSTASLDRRMQIFSTDANKNHKYKYTKISLRDTTPFHRVRGGELAKNLGIPNKSITVVDFDQVFKYLKQNSKSCLLSKQEKTAARQPADIDFTLYWLFNPIIAADSARKRQITSPKVFNNFEGINVTALVNRDFMTFHGQNNDLKMSFDVTTTYRDVGIVETIQTWHPQTLDASVFGGETNLTQTNANISNNKKEVYKMAKKLCGRRGMKSPPSDGIPASLHQYNCQVLSLFRKRSGDLFQGYLTKHHGMMGNVRPWTYTEMMKDSAGPGKFLPPNLGNIAPVPFTNYSKVDGVDVFMTTGDYPHLIWCLENGVNVVFRASNTNCIFYFQGFICGHFGSNMQRFKKQTRKHV